MTSPHSRSLAGEPSFVELFTPKLVTVLREGYDLSRLRADAIAGLTVAIVALPLSMAIAIASGVGPERGLYTAIVGGFIISAIGGSRFQVGGPAGAFIVLVASIVERRGIDGLLLATFLAGFLMLGIGYLRLGRYIQFIPHPVIIGFTAGIAVIIMASQVRDLLGLTLSAAEPAALVPKVVALWRASSTFNATAFGLGLAGVVAIMILRRQAPRLPGFLIVVAAGALVVWLFGLPVETIGSRFGGIPAALPAPILPPINFTRIVEIMPDAVAIALLGSIESLLSAVVADGMTGRRHRSNCELVAQGAANIASALFGGICATGTIARTATNVRAGAIGPVAGMLHSVFLLLAMLAAAPLMREIPLAILASVLLVVAWNMFERDVILQLFRHSRGEAVVLAVTLLFTVFRDLTEGIAVGVALGSLLFMRRMAALVAVRTGENIAAGDLADSQNGDRAPYDSSDVRRSDVIVYHIAGPLFFGAAGHVASVLEGIGAQAKTYILDLAAVPFADTTAAVAVRSFVDKVGRSGATVRLAGANQQVRRVLVGEGLREPQVHYDANVAAAVENARNVTAEPDATSR